MTCWKTIFLLNDTLLSDSLLNDPLLNDVLKLLNDALKNITETHLKRIIDYEPICRNEHLPTTTRDFSSRRR